MASPGRWSPASDVIWVEDAFLKANIADLYTGLALRCRLNDNITLVDGGLRLHACDGRHSFQIYLTRNAIQLHNSDSSEDFSQCYLLCNAPIKLEKVKVIAHLDCPLAHAYMFVVVEEFAVRIEPGAAADSRKDSVGLIPGVESRLRQLWSDYHRHDPPDPTPKQVVHVCGIIKDIHVLRSTYNQSKIEEDEITESVLDQRSGDCPMSCTEVDKNFSNILKQISSTFQSEDESMEILNEDVEKMNHLRITENDELNAESSLLLSSSSLLGSRTTKDSLSQLHGLDIAVMEPEETEESQLSSGGNDVVECSRSRVNSSPLKRSREKSAFCGGMRGSQSELLRPTSEDDSNMVSASSQEVCGMDSCTGIIRRPPLEYPSQRMKRFTVAYWQGKARLLDKDSFSVFRQLMQ